MNDEICLHEEIENYMNRLKNVPYTLIFRLMNENKALKAKLNEDQIFACNSEQK